MTEPTLRPVELLTKVAQKYPKLWRHYEDMRAQRGKDLPDWPTWCYSPLAAAYAIVSGGGSNSVAYENATDIGLLGAVAAWRPTKGIYRFDPDLAKELIETPIKGEMPREVLYRLPEWCVYIETARHTTNMHGFFAHLEWDANDGRTELRLLLDMEDGITPVPLHLVPGDLEDSLRAMEAEAAYQSSLRSRFVMPSMAKDLEKHVAPLLSLVLYLCSDQPDFGDVDRKPEHPKARKTNKGMKLQAAEAPTTWNVGVRIGAALRKARANSPNNLIATESHASPRAHVRRAHWHTYWTGPKDKEQKPKLKWLSPILVGAEDELVPTVHPVKQE
jgi:hypothetical protein